MEVRIRYLSGEIAKLFQSSGKTETVRFSDEAKYSDLLGMFKERLKRSRDAVEKVIDSFVILCGGRVLPSIKDEVVDPNHEVWVGFADTGG